MQQVLVIFNPRIGRLCLLSAAFVAMAMSAQAQGPAPSPLLPAVPPAPAKVPATAPQPTPPPALTRADLETFLDALVPSQLQNRNVAGAVVSVVKDGQLLFAKGYGYADFAARKAVLADQTLFRPGSISKLFTAIAVMQLVEEGKLDLDRDVNDYLDFAIAKTYQEPITLRRLLTHTAGFEETVKNLFVPSAEVIKPLRDYLITAMPAQIFPPGKIPSYSNYGLSLAGYIVQRTSGEQFESYIDNHIFKPLKMESSTFAQPLPATINGQMSRGYIRATKPAVGFEFVQAAPAGALSATATDMSRFMLALLQDGTLEGATILKPASVHEMEARQFEVHPQLEAMGLIFMDYSTNGQRLVGHGGDTIYFHSDMFLIPDAHIGFFISYNSAGSKAGSGRGEVKRAVLDRYFPKPQTEDAQIDAKIAQADGHAVRGVYEVTRRAESTVFKLPALLGEIAIKADRDGILTIEDFKNLRGELKRWREVGPLLYHEIDGPEMMAFRRDATGTVREMLPQPPIYEAQRVVWYENKHLLMPIIGGSLAFSTLTLLLWPVAAMIRKRYQRRLFDDSADRILYFLSRLTCLIQVVWLGIVIALLTRAGENIALLGDGLNPWLHALHALGWMFAVGVVLWIVTSIRFCLTSGLGWWLRAHSILLALAGLIFVWFSWHCHMLDTSLKF